MHGSHDRPRRGKVWLSAAAMCGGRNDAAFPGLRLPMSMNFLQERWRVSVGQRQARTSAERSAGAARGPRATVARLTLHGAAPGVCISPTSGAPVRLVKAVGDAGTAPT